MSGDSETTPWPPEAGPPADLRRDAVPPAELEDRVVSELASRGLLAGRAGPVRRGPRPLHLARAAVAALVLLAAGFTAGRLVPAGGGAPPAAAAADSWALVLFEGPEFVPARGLELGARYDEYSRWVAEARRRGQFVDGIDLATEAGWLLSPAPGGPAVTAATAPGTATAVSGVFLITAAGPEAALELAAELPHLAHGGRVGVQRVLPTDSRPVVDGEPESTG